MSEGVGQLLHALRETGLSLDDIANKLGYSRETVRHWLNGSVRPSRRGVHAIQNLVYQRQKKTEAQKVESIEILDGPGIPPRLREAIEQQNLSYRQIAARTGYSRETVSHCFCGKREATPRFLQALHRMLEHLDGKAALGIQQPLTYPTADETPPPPPSDVCTHHPGSVEKIEMLRQRALRQEHLWSPQDRGYDDEPMGLSY